MAKKYFGETKVFKIDGEEITIGTYGYGLQKELGELARAGKTQESLDKFLAEVIVKWSLTEEDGTPLPVSNDAFNRLSGPFMNQIIEVANEFNGITVDQVKN
jgi:hypothetical protein